MEISLTSEQEEFVQRMVQKKGFGSPEEVLRAALLCLDGYFFDEDFNRKRLEEDIQKGLDQYERGEYVSCDAESFQRLKERIKADGMKRLEEKRKLSA